LDECGQSEQASGGEQASAAERDAQIQRDTSRVLQLEGICKTLSSAASARTLLSSWRIERLLEQSGLQDDFACATEQAAAYHKDLEWLLLGKISTQVHGVILDTLLQEIAPISEDIWYWDDVLGSYAYSGLYTIQTSPLELWNYGKGIWGDAQARWDRLKVGGGLGVEQAGVGTSLSGRWKQFYGLVGDAIHDRKFSDVQSRVMSPVTQARAAARRKQKQLKRLREMNATGLGILINGSLSFGMDEEDDLSQHVAGAEEQNVWQRAVAKSVLLMESVLQNVGSVETETHDFEASCFYSMDNAQSYDAQVDAGDLLEEPSLLATKLEQILRRTMPEHRATSQAFITEHGRPSFLVRYWLPTTVLLVSSSTILRILVNRKAEILTWIRELGQTAIDFWHNWVVEPVRKIIGTIRHDKDSGIAIMSKESLEGDRASLERMVVDFATDHPEGLHKLSDAQAAEVRAKVREGDLTPVLKAYERDLRSPFMGAVRGDLIRALLIQVQKTKVDVEVAMGGIDALLKSQELVFGFVGLTPGVLVCLGLGSWLSGTFGGRKGRAKGKKQVRMIRVLR